MSQQTDRETRQNETGGSPALDERSRRRAEIRGVIALSIPMVITTSSRALMDIADYTMITWIGVPEAQAALLPAQIVMWSYIVAGVGIVSVVSTFAAQALGRKEYGRCSSYAWQALYIAAFFGLLAEAFRPLLYSVIAAFGHDPGVQAMELAYTRVALRTAAPTIAAYGLGWFFVGIHRPWTTMWSAIEANVVNIAVSYVLIFGHLGFEPLGIEGAAWGTLAAVIYRALRLFVTLLLPKTASVFDTRRTWRPSWRSLSGLLRVGAPCSLQWITDVAVWAIFVNVLVGSKFGMLHLIATNSAWQYMRIAFLPTLGMGQALTALVGKSIGAGRPDRARREARTAALITFAYMGSLSVVYALFGADLIRFFSDDEEVIRIGRTIMLCAACFQLFDGIAIAYNSALRGAGDTFVPSLFVMGSNWVMIVGAGWLMATWYPQLGSLGPWLAASALIIVTGIFLWLRWRSGAWMRMDLFKDGKEAGKPVASTMDEPAAAASPGG